MAAWIGKSNGIVGSLLFILFSVAPGIYGQDATPTSLYFTVRDFSHQHPDFEENRTAPTFCGYDFNAPMNQRTKGMVEPVLGADRKPLHTSANTCPTKNIDNWFRDGSGDPTTGALATYCIEVELQPVAGTQNIYSYNSDAFFPIDDRPSAEIMDGHNYHFTMETHTAFQYRGGERFRFVGDDDVWVFINGRLAVDLGGVHFRDSQTVDLDAQADQLGITPGNYYRFDMFYCERHTDNSTLHLETSIDFLPPSPEGVYIGDGRDNIIPDADTLVLADSAAPYQLRGILVQNVEEELECQRVISQTTSRVSGTWYLDGTPVGTGESFTLDPSSITDGGLHWLAFDDGTGRDSLLLNIRQVLSVSATPPAGAYNGPLRVELSSQPVSAPITYWQVRDTTGYTVWSGIEGTADTIEGAGDTLRYRIPAPSFNSTWNDTFKLFMNAAGTVSIGVRIGGRTTEFAETHMPNGAWGTAEANGDFLIEIFTLDDRQAILRPMPSAVRRSPETVMPGTAYDGPIVLSADHVIKAIAAKPGYIQSDTLVAAYTILPGITPAPAILPAERVFQDSIVVSILCDSVPAAAIYHTLDGSTPTLSSSPYDGSFTLRDTTTVKAIAIEPGRDISEVVSATFIRVPARVSTPRADPSGTSFVGTLSITLHDSTPEAVIRYTLDGSKPTESSTAYNDTPITIDTTTRLRVMAFRERWYPSTELDERYTLRTPTVSTPWAQPAGRGFRDSVVVALYDTTDEAVIHYTLDGTTPDASSPVYTEPLVIQDTTTVRAIALKHHWLPSEVVVERYYPLVPRASMPWASPSGRSFYGSLDVALHDSTPGAVIRYTTDGTVPDTLSPRYGDPITLTGPATIRAVAYADGYALSPIMTEIYTRSPSGARYGYFLDRNADGRIDSAVVVFDTLPYGAPSMVTFTDPNDTAVTVAMPAATASIFANSIGYALSSPFERGTNPPAGEWASIGGGDDFVAAAVVMHDSVPPVIASAVYHQAAWDASREGDRLVVRFSEPVSIRVTEARGEPFLLSRAGTSYRLELARGSYTGQEITFGVESIHGVSFPAAGDSVSLRPLMAVDHGGAIQRNPRNRRRALELVCRPVPITAEVTSNPMRTGVDGSPIPPYALLAAQSFPGAPAWMRSIGTGTAVRLRPVHAEAASKTTINGTVWIYDAVGNLVTEKYPVVNDGPGDAWVLWHGLNRNGRRVGGGTYLMVIKAAVDLDGSRYEESLRRYIGVVH